MSKGKKSKDRLNLVGYDPVESPEEIIGADKNIDRKEAFKQAYVKVMMIVPEYFINKKKKKKNGAGGSSGGNSFTQNIVVTPENVKLETKETVTEQEREEEREK